MGIGVDWWCGIDRRRAGWLLGALCCDDVHAKLAGVAMLPLMARLHDVALPVAMVCLARVAAVVSDRSPADSEGA